MTSKIYVAGMYGLGDTVYLRPFIKNIAKHYDEVYMRTPWPELFCDIPNVLPVWHKCSLRTQKRSILSWTGKWHDVPKDCDQISIRYDADDLTQMSIMETMAHKTQDWLVDHPELDVPVFDEELYGLLDPKKPLAVVRPVTTRLEWDSRARGCDPEYIQQSIDILKAKGYHVVLLYDVDGDLEQFVGDKPHGMDVDLNSSSEPRFFRAKFLISLLQEASIVVGPVGWIAPMGYAMKVPTIIIHGGRGGHNHPKVISPGHGYDNVKHIMPDNYCICDGRKPNGHVCDKHISDFSKKFSERLDAVTVGQ